MKMAIEQVWVSGMNFDTGGVGEAPQEIGGISKDLKRYLYEGTAKNNWEDKED